MIHGIIERFRYRFELWCRERREDYFGAPRNEPAEEPDYVSRYSSNPKWMLLVTESTVSSIGRLAGAYFGIIIIAAQITLLIGRLIPPVRFAISVIFLVFAGLWTLLMVTNEIELRKARRQWRQQQTTKSS